MSYNTNIPIVTNGLVFYNDPANYKSGYYSDKVACDIPFAGVSTSPYLTSASTDFDYVPNTSFSVGGWIYLTTTNADLGVFNKSSTVSGTRSWLVQFMNSGDDFRFDIYYDGINGVSFTTSGTQVANTWIFLVVTFGYVDNVNNRVGIYVNGTANVNTTTPYQPFSGTANFAIGTYLGSTRLLRGRVDSCFYYNKELSGSEVTTLYNSGNGQIYDDVDKVGLVSYWRMNEPIDVRLDSFGTNHLAIGGSGDLYYIDGKIANDGNQLLYCKDLVNNVQGVPYNNISLTYPPYSGILNTFTFDGVNDYIDFTNTVPSVVYSATLTTTVWVKAGYSTPSSTDIVAFIGSTTAPVDTPLLVIAIRNDKTNYFHVSRGGSISGNTQLQSSVAIPIDQWNEITVIRRGDSGSLSMYINGVDVGTASTSFNTGDNVNKIVLGTSYLDGAYLTNYFQGEMSSIKIYNRELSASEILQNYNATKFRFI